MRERFRESLRGRMRVATELAIGGHVDRASAALSELQTAMDAADEEMAARYYLAWALLRLNERGIEDAFAAFERALASARRFGDSALITGVLTNYGTAVAQDGNIATAVTCFEEARRVDAGGNRRFVTTLCLAEALFASGALQRAASILHELYEGYADTVTLICAATVGIPLERHGGRVTGRQRAMRAVWMQREASA